MQLSVALNAKDFSLANLIGYRVLYVAIVKENFKK